MELAVLALGISAFFWLPALGERGWVQSERLLGTWVFDYGENFLPLADVLALPRSADPSLINDWPPKALGLVPTLVAVLPLARWRTLERQAKWQVTLLLILSIGFAIMTVPLSKPLWDSVPLLHYVQFPWRFLGPAALCVALLCGAALPSFRSDKPSAQRYLIAVGLVLVLSLASLGWFYPSHCESPDDISLAGMIAWERGTDTIGTTAAGEYLPIWVQRMPQDSGLAAAYAADTPRVRLRPESLPPGAQVLHAEYDRLRSTFILDTPTSFQAVYMTFYYPGWYVTIDGEPVEVSPSEPEGLVSFPVPEGNHTIHVWFGETPLRWTSDTISVLTLIGLAASIYVHRARNKLGGPDLSSQRADSYSLKQLWPLLILAVLLPVLKLSVFDHVDNPIRHSRLENGNLENVDIPSEATFDGEFRLLGFDSIDRELAADQPLEINLYWQDTVSGGPEYRIGLALKDSEGLTWNAPYLRPPRWHRTPPPAYTWPPESYALTAFLMNPLPGTPPGAYTVTIGVFDHGTLAPYPVSGPPLEQPTSVELEVALGQVEITRPRRTPTIESLSPQFSADETVGPVTLVGYNLDREEAAPGAPFLLTLFWRSDEPYQDRLEVQLQLMRLNSPRGFEWPLIEILPVSEWVPGDLWRDQHLIRLPAWLESGEYLLALGSFEGATEYQPIEATVSLGRLQINAPQRVWEPPPLDIETDVRMGDVATLLGAVLLDSSDSIESGGTLTITLVWQAQAETDTSYRVFIHLIDPSGAVVTQSDGEPASWSRPTTGWLPGEIVLDTHILNIPPEAESGSYTIQTGVYTLKHGRLTTADGSDAVPLFSLQVIQE
jgi:hypothetical protein